MKFIPLLAGLLFPFQDTFSIILNDAIKKKLIKAQFEWKEEQHEESQSDRFGRKLHLTIKNISGANQNIEIPSGFVFQPANEGNQDQMVTDLITYNLKPGEQKEQTVKTYCIQAHDGCPAEGEKFTAKGMSNNLLTKLAQFVNTNKLKSYTVQRAVWSVSDNNPIEDIYSTDTSEMRKLYYFTGNLKGKTNEDLNKGYCDVLKHYKANKATDYSLKCEVDFKQDTYYWVIVQDINNVTKKVIQIKKPVSAGQYTYTYNFSSIDLGSGSFILRLYSYTNPLVEVPFKLEI